jgi:exonuclease-1
VLVGPDLRDAFDDHRTSDIDCFEDDAPVASGSTPTPSPSPLTPEDEMSGDLALALVDPEEAEAEANATRSEAVAAGWRERWVLPNSKDKGRATPTLRRRETNVTPAGRHLPINAHLRPHPYLHDAPSSVPSKYAGGKAKPLQSRRSLTFLDPVRPKLTKGRQSDVLIAGEDEDNAVAKAHIRLAQYRSVDIADSVLVTY